MSLTCPYCNKPAKLVDGSVIYPHRADLHALKFWQCAPCGAYVGCHRPNAGYGDGTRPLGRLANARLRALKSKVHAAFDPLWEKHGKDSRRLFYGWLADQLGIQFNDCHIGMFDEALCRKALHVIANTEPPKL